MSSDSRDPYTCFRKREALRVRFTYGTQGRRTLGSRGSAFSLNRGELAAVRFYGFFFSFLLYIISRLCSCCRYLFDYEKHIIENTHESLQSFRKFIVSEEAKEIRAAKLSYRRKHGVVAWVLEANFRK